MGNVVRLPKLGLEMDQGKILEWFVDEGDTVSEGDVLAEFETEKTVGEVEARTGGVLRKVYLHEGESIGPGAPIAIIAESDEDIDSLVSQVSDEFQNEMQDFTDSERKLGSQGSENGESQPSKSETVRASPRAKKRASELDIDIAILEGTGPEGAITVSDVERHRDERDELPTKTLLEERPLDGLRKTISERLGESYRNAIHVTEHLSVNASDLLSIVEEANEVTKEELTVVDFIIAGLSAALREHNEFNATFEAGTHNIYQEHNINIAVDTGTGLITPTLREVNEKTIPQIAARRKELRELVSDGEHDPDHLSEGTFTITNLGPFGIESFNPVINPPQVAILGVNAIESKPTPANSGTSLESVGFDRYLPLSLSFDHRVIDGADAARFLNTLKNILEEPREHFSEEIPHRPEDKDASDMPERHLVARLEGTYSGTIDAGGVGIPFDEPVDVGGDGKAPTPVDVFLGSLAACLTNSIKYQANKRDVDLSSLEVTVDGFPEEGNIESIEVTVNTESETEISDIDHIISLGEKGCYVSNIISEDIPVEIHR